MNSNLKVLNVNFFILLLLVVQIIIVFVNSPIEKIVKSYQSDSLEKFTTIISGDENVDVISADKMVKINENKTMLIGDTSLKNNEFEILSKNVTIDSQNMITSSVKETETTNNQGVIKSEGFEFDQNTNIIKFNGKSEFHTDEN
tara:strand:- start:1148 stop:1579 length:432 start_codon:yes stop_codon:yes gene_type:complete